jgi:hypothetical protein
MIGLLFSPEIAVDCRGKIKGISKSFALIGVINTIKSQITSTKILTLLNYLSYRVRHLVIKIKMTNYILMRCKTI